FAGFITQPFAGRPNNFVLTNNVFTNSDSGMFLQALDDSLVENNTVEDNYSNGIITQRRADRNVFTGNTMNNNPQNFVINSFSTIGYDNTVDTTNTVDGKPIIYITGQNGGTIGPASNAGTVFCIRCTNVVIEDLTLNNNGASVILVETNDSTVRNIISTGNRVGMLVIQSSRNTISDNTLNPAGFFNLFVTGGGIWSDEGGLDLLTELDAADKPGGVTGDT
ncbi:MAG: right-handed parallel beta-helix repeat-containing protein, partial [Chloroflexi bacterium]|nr:right-handed parallel beta-helix repeat-containing protein [Chloroflexota bacterium]